MMNRYDLPWRKRRKKAQKAHNKKRKELFSYAAKGGGGEAGSLSHVAVPLIICVERAEKPPTSCYV